MRSKDSKAGRGTQYPSQGHKPHPRDLGVCLRRASALGGQRAPHTRSQWRQLWSPPKLERVPAQGYGTYCGVQGKRIWGLCKADYGKFGEALKVGRGKDQGSLQKTKHSKREE